MKRMYWVYGIGAAALLIAISVAGTYVGTSNYYKGILAGVRVVRETDTRYQFISPLLNVVVPKEVASGQFTPLVNKIKAVAQAEPESTFMRYSVYFRDLNNNYWTGINENDQYDPGSMLKVVAAIAAYRQDEDHPGFFNLRPVYTKELAQLNAEFPYAPKVVLKVGSSYSIPYLIETMLSDSDNASKDLLLSAISTPELDDIYNDLVVPKPNDNDTANYEISALDYSRFFRALYNGTYLTRSDSNQMLGFLASSTYSSGLVAGVPSSLVVAHKFGEHVNGANNIASSIELHDCGIIYMSPDPYFLCVMTEGSDETALASFIAKISKAVFEEVTTGYK